MKCRTCQAEATVHIEVLALHLCATCLEAIDARARALVTRSNPGDWTKYQILGTGGDQLQPRVPDACLRDFFGDSFEEDR